MGKEPNIPLVEGDLIQDDDTKLKGSNDPVNGNSNTDKAGDDDKSKHDGEDGEESSQVTGEQYKQLVEGWKEDRDYYKGEIKRLRSEANNPKLSQSEEDELEGLEEDERVDKIIEFRKEREEKASEAELKSVKSEIRFYERTDKEFAKNKKSILKVAEDYDCPDLKQAVLIWRGLNVTKSAKDKAYNDKRKKEADGKAGGKSGGEISEKPYNAKTDSKKSFGDFYREGGL